MIVRFKIYSKGEIEAQLYKEGENGEEILHACGSGNNMAIALTELVKEMERIAIKDSFDRYITEEVLRYPRSDGLGYMEFLLRGE